MKQINYIMDEYIQSLLSNHRYKASYDTRDLTTREDYKEILIPVVRLFDDFPNQSVKFYRELLERQSLLKSNLDKIIYDQRLVPGVVVAYGTSKYVGLLNEGFADEGNNKKMDDKSIFDLSSVSKLFLTVVVLCLYSDGYFDLDRKILEYDKRFYNLKDMTVRDILSFQRIIKTPERLTAGMSVEKADKIMFAAYEDDGENSINSYSDIPFMVLRYIIETVSQSSTFDLINHYILKPLGMTDTVVAIPQEKLSRTVSSDNEYYIINDGEPIHHITPLGIVNDDKSRIFAAHGQFAGHAGLFSTVCDMIKFIHAFFGDKILSPNILNEIGVNRTGKRNEDGRYRQYLGYGCYSKNPDAIASEVYHPLSGNAIAMSGFTGNHLSIDINNQVFTFIVTNRCHNRVSKFVNSPKALDSIVNKGEQSILRFSSCQDIGTSHRYVYQKDGLLRDPALQLALQNRLLDLCNE